MYGHYVLKERCSTACHPYQVSVLRSSLWQVEQKKQQLLLQLWVLHMKKIEGVQVIMRAKARAEERLAQRYAEGRY